MSIVIELEIRNRDAEWIVKSTHYCSDFKNMKNKIKEIKKIYALHNKDYRIYMKLPSKLNKKRV